MRHLFAAVLALALLSGAAVADDIVTMPTANHLKKGEVDIADYYLDLDLPAGAPRFVHYQTLYVGITDNWEVDLHRADVDRDETSLVVVTSYKLLAEGPTYPDLVVGVRNLFGDRATNNPALRDDSEEPSVYLSAAKTFFLRPDRPGPPLVRWHMSLGSRDWTLLGEPRHEGVFGGLQFLFHPTVGAVAQYDGQDWITAVTYMPPKTGLTLKAGTYGRHEWVGISYRRAVW